jgi:CubicO group peptidase (beta-lactamase class C family)
MTTGTGFNDAALKRIVDTIQGDVDNELYDGAVIKIARHGDVALDEAIGFTDRAAGRAAAHDDIFKVFSLTKAFTNTMILRAIDLGLLSLTTPVVDVLPEFWGKDMFRAGRKNLINIGHLLTHRAGMSPTPKPVGYDQIHDLDTLVAAICEMDVVGVPGSEFNYSPTINHALMGAIAKRVFGVDSFRELVRRELFEPLGMADSSIGVIASQKDRLVPVVPAMPEASWITNEDTRLVAEAMDREGSEMPWVGAATSVPDVFKFAEMLRTGGTVDGHRILSPAILQKSTTLQTGDMINDLYRHLAEPRGWETPPGNMGLGFALGGTGLTISQFGTLTSPGTFGNFGAGSTLFWVDPVSGITFVCLTAKVIEEGNNIARFQRISDLVASAAL